MNIKFGHAWMHLDKDRALRLTDADGTQILLRSGSLWVTQDRDQKDYVLEAGDAFKLDRAGDAILYALGNSEIELVEPSPAAHGTTGPGRLLANAVNAAGGWISRRFGPQAVANRSLRYWGNAI